MHEHPAARSAATGEGTTDMDELRKCTGSTRFGIEAHEAPVEDFPSQPSQKDGLGRMCKTHWNQYTAGLARDAKARNAAEGGPDDPTVPFAEATGPEEPPDAVAPAKRSRRAEPVPVADGEEVVG
jgi:hypothetical protein